jgi:hypothetical protein
MNWFTRAQSAIYFTFTDRKYYLIGASTFIIVFFLYLIILPANNTGGQISLANLNYLSFQLAIFAFIMAGLLSLIVPMNFKLKASGQRTHSAGTIAGGIGGLLGSLLCCSFILPSIVAFIAAILPNATFLMGVQGFIATHEPLILLASLLILIYAFLISVHQIVNCPSCQIKGHH